MLGIQRAAMFGAMAYQWNVVAGGDPTYRSDTYASNVFLALPFDETSLYGDVSQSINSGSTIATATNGANSALTTADVLWNGAPSYGKSLENLATSGTASMTYALSTSIPSSASGTFVIEGWFNADNSTTNSNWAISSGEVNGRFLFGINNGSSFTFGNENNIGIGTGWHHLAIVCDGGTKRFYYDGIYKGAWVSSNTGFTTIHIGQFNASDNNDYQGHIQDFRVTIGSNRGYTGTNSGTANFTLPGSIIESYPAAAGGAAAASRSTITVNGDAQIDTARSKFGGASLLLDGTSDWVTVSDIAFDSQTEFTWECFFNVDQDAGGGTVSLMSNRTGGYDAGDLMLLFRNYDMKLQLSSSGTGGMNLAPVSMSAISIDTWHHVAVSRNSSGDWGLFFNGTRLSNGTGWTETLDNDAGVGIGAHADGGLTANSGTNAWFDEVRISKIARYDPSSTSITVPTSAFTNDNDTLALLHMDGADGDVSVSDDETAPSSTTRTAKTVTAYGDAQVSTTQSNFGGASLYSDGATDYLVVASHQDFVMGSSDFTLECWVRPANSGVGSGDQIISKWSGGNGYSFGLTYGSSSPKNNIRALINDTGGIRGVNMGSNPLTVDAWNHVALVVESGTLALYANGNRLGTTSVTAFNDATNTDITISALINGSYSPNHYQDEVRISDTARYTGSTYTVPTTAFTNDANTLLLLHMDGANGDTTFTDDNT